VAAVLNNLILSTAMQVVVGALPFRRAISYIAESAELASLTDDQLIRAIHAGMETIREDRSISVENPSAQGVRAELIFRAATRRLERISSLKQATQEGHGEEQQLSQRMARFLTVAAECALLRGWTMLLLPRPEEALKQFHLAETFARSLPDSGELRLTQVIGAVIGRNVCACMLRDKSGFDSTTESTARLSQIPGREQEAGEAIGHHRKWFRDALSILRAAAPRTPKGERGKAHLTHRNT
jgi:hypothetical protein